MTKKELYQQICDRLGYETVDAKKAGIPIEERINKRFGIVGNEIGQENGILYLINKPGLLWKFAESEKKVKKEILQSILDYMNKFPYRFS